MTDLDPSLVTHLITVLKWHDLALDTAALNAVGTPSERSARRKANEYKALNDQLRAWLRYQQTLAALAALPEPAAVGNAEGGPHGWW